MRLAGLNGLCLVASMLVLAAAASAQPNAPSPGFNAAAPENREVLPAFSYATVEPVLTQIGARFERAGTDERPALAVTFANGRRAAILFGSCLGTSCRAISIQAVWNAPSGNAAERLGPAVQAFSQRYAFSRAFVAADGRPSLQRYLTADYGFIRGNLAVNLIVFAGQIERFVSEVLQAPGAGLGPLPSTSPLPSPSPPAAAPDPTAPRRRPGADEARPRP